MLLSTDECVVDVHLVLLTTLLYLSASDVLASRVAATNVISAIITERSSTM